MKLNNLQTHIMLHLSASCAHGYALHKALARVHVKVSRQALYKELRRMRDLGLLRSTTVESSHKPDAILYYRTDMPWEMDVRKLSQRAVYDYCTQEQVQEYLDSLPTAHPVDAAMKRALAKLLQPTIRDLARIQK